MALPASNGLGMSSRADTGHSAKPSLRRQTESLRGKALVDRGDTYCYDQGQNDFNT